MLYQPGGRIKRLSVVSTIVTVLQRWAQGLRDGLLAGRTALIVAGLMATSLCLEVMLRAVGV